MASNKLICMVHKEKIQQMKGCCYAPLFEECLYNYGHKKDIRVTSKTCSTIGERAQVNLV